MKLEFFDLNVPPIARGAQYLVEQAVAERAIDLSRHLVVVPASRAGRRLLELLVEQAAARDKLLAPPQIVTLGALPEELYPPQRPLADRATQQLAWIEALRSVPRDALGRFFATLPADDDLPTWLNLADLLAVLHDELAAHLLDFNDVPKLGKKLDHFQEAERWQLLSQVQSSYLAALDRLEVWDRQTARRVAIDKRECRIDRQVVLMGTADLNLAQRRMLEQVAAQVTAIVFAPPAWRTRFDRFGCLMPAAWREVEIPLADEQIHVVDGPAEQADEVIRALARLGGKYGSDEITLGLVDARLEPFVSQRLDECGLNGRYGPGAPIASSAPYRLLLAAADYLQSSRFDAFAALVRQPALANLIRAKVPEDWLTACDQYAVKHLPWRVDGRWPTDAPGPLKKAYEVVERWLGALAHERRPWNQWGEPIANLLVTAYGDQPLDRNRAGDRTVVVACEAIAEVLKQHAQLSGRVAPQVDGAAALQLTLRALRGETIPPPADDGLEMLGWLDLAWDDARALIVAGFNEELVPTCRQGDMFLPNALRRQLQIEDDERCFARDAYALSLIVATRPTLQIIAGRRTADGDPLLPSRLLTRCDELTAAKRARAWFGDPQPHVRLVLPNTLKPGVQAAQFQPPPPRPLDKPLEVLRVTHFRDYLQCPYRFYLKHCLGLKSQTDVAEELDGGQFGELLHDALKWFGNSQLKESTDETEIYEALSAWLDDQLEQQFGQRALPAVRVQVEQARKRLEGFAHFQVNARKNGLQIRHVERDFDDLDISLLVDGQKMRLAGRVDRIDFDENTGDWWLFDYKTGNTVESPEKQHRRRGKWVDLQLPLYRLIAGPLKLEGPLKLAFIPLSKSNTPVKLDPAHWDDAELDEAEQVARQVIRDIRAEIFWPPNPDVPADFDEFAELLRDFKASGTAARRGAL